MEFGYFPWIGVVRDLKTRFDDVINLYNGFPCEVFELNCRYMVGSVGFVSG